VLRDLGRALFEPRRFFGALRGHAPNAGRAYLALLLPATLGALVQLARADSILAQAPAFARDLSPEVLRSAFYIGTLVGGPLAALLLWLAGWLPLRVGAGRFARIGEVAAWTQLPAAFTSLLGHAVNALGVPPSPLTLAVQAGSVLWCGWLVYEALRVFSPGRVRGGVIAYALFALGLLALGLAGPVGGGGSPDGLVF